MRGVNDDELADFVELTRERAVTVRFIEYMPFDGNKWNDRKMVTYAQMLDEVRSAHPDLRRVEDEPNDTAKGYRERGNSIDYSDIGAHSWAETGDAIQYGLLQYCPSQSSDHFWNFSNGTSGGFSGHYWD